MKKLFLFIGCIVLVTTGCTQLKPGEIYKTALYTVPMYYCEFTEWSKPSGYIVFAYQEAGQIHYIKTQTTCDDLKNDGTLNDVKKNSIIFGEKIKLFYKENVLTEVTRENGNSYTVAEALTGQAITTYFGSNIRVDRNLKNIENRHIDEFINECQSLENTQEHDNCLSYQAAFQKDDGICDQVIAISNQTLCREWVSNIIAGKLLQ